MDVLREELRLALRGSLVLGALAVLTACTPDSGAPDRVATATAAPAGIVDSALPMDAQIRRFRATGDTVRALQHGAPSADALVRTYVSALGQRDTSAVLRLTLTRSEFAWLYFPTSRLASPAYALPPELAWFQVRGNSEHDLRKAMNLVAGTGARYLSHRCESVRREGGNRLHESCVVVMRDRSGATLERVLFGSMLERDGTFKLVGLANKL